MCGCFPPINVLFNTCTLINIEGNTSGIINRKIIKLFSKLVRIVQCSDRKRKCDYIDLNSFLTQTNFKTPKIKMELQTNN